MNRLSNTLYFWRIHKTVDANVVNLILLTNKHRCHLCLKSTTDAILKGGLSFTDNWFKNIFCVCCCHAIIFILLTYISHFHCFNSYLDHCCQQDSIRWYVIEKSLCLSRTSILIQWVFGFLLFFCLFVWFYLIDMHFFIFFITEMQSAWVWYTNWECRRKQTSLVYCVHIYGFWWWWRSQ